MWENSLEPVVEGVGAVKHVGQEKVQQRPQLVQVILRHQKRRQHPARAIGTVKMKQQFNNTALFYMIFPRHQYA